MLIEMTIALTLLVIAIGALMSIYASNIVSLRHASTEGTALTLAERQMETYKTLPYDDVRLNTATIPSSSTDPYETAHSSDDTIPASTGQVSGGTVTSTACNAPTGPQAECTVQLWTGPDGKNYRVDSYIASGNPSGGGRAVMSGTVLVREMTGTTPSARIWSRVSSVIDLANPPT